MMTALRRSLSKVSRSLRRSQPCLLTPQEHGQSLSARPTPRTPHALSRALKTCHHHLQYILLATHPNLTFGLLTHTMSRGSPFWWTLACINGARSRNTSQRYNARMYWRLLNLPLRENTPRSWQNGIRTLSNSTKIPFIQYFCTHLYISSFLSSCNFAFFCFLYIVNHNYIHIRI